LFFGPSRRGNREYKRDSWEAAEEGSSARPSPDSSESGLGLVWSRLQNFEEEASGA